MWANLNKAPPAHYDNRNDRPRSNSSSASSFLEPPPRYSAEDGRDYSDPRQSSQQSLVPSNPDLDDDERRTLLVIYIHGFNGNSQSFRSFPAHVHNFLKSALADTHVVHSKLYPRYKTYRAVEVARDKFSEWLEPHEGPNVDVILVGHSMGGILAADVILIPNQDHNAQQPFKHRILGHVSLDCPFLGLHPGIIVSGIASLFQSAPKPPQDPTYIQPKGSQSTLAIGDDASLASASGSSPYSTLPPESRRPDPHFNAPFFNDTIYEERPFLQSIFSFVKKHHAEGIANSFAQRLTDQLEFGGCLADYSGLHARYKKLRALEDVDEVRMVGEGHPQGAHAQVRFVNYYTLSSGVPKKPKTAEAEAEDDTGVAREQSPGNSSEMDKLDIDPLQDGSSDSGFATPRSNISVRVEDYSHKPSSSSHADIKATSASEKNESHEGFSRLSMQNIDPTPISEDDEPDGRPESTTQVTEEHTAPDSVEGLSPQRTSTEELNLPPLPEEPSPPVLPDLDTYTDKTSRKQAEKESKRLQKAYEQAVKDRAKSIREREKLIEKRRKEAQKALDKQHREAQKKLDRHAQKENQRLQKEEQRLEKEKQRMEREAEKLHKKSEPANNTSDVSSQLSREQLEKERLSEDQALQNMTTQDAEAIKAEAAAPKKRKKFCTLPRKVNGKADEAWVDIYMENMNEVTAHCGLFFAGPHYDKLVGEVGSKIVGWVHDDLTKRAILNMPVD